MGLSAAARCAGYIPAPIVMSPNVTNDSMIASGEITGGGTTCANLPGALGDAAQHAVHYADATERQRHHSNRAEDDGHDVENSLHQLRTVERIPDEEGVCVGGIEVVLASENLIDLTHRLFVLFRISDF